MRNSFLLLPWVLLISCASTTKLSDDDRAVKIGYNLHVGSSWGGVIEDATIDAVTGATKFGFNIGVHPTIDIRGRMIETGLDYIQYNQSFSYQDSEAGFNGERKLNYGELRVPVTYNFQLFRDKDNEGILQLKLGLSAGYRIHENIEDSGNNPAFTFDKFSIGPTLGVSIVPFKISENYKLGLYFDVMRGSKVYTDEYTVINDFGQLSSIKFGLMLRMR